MWAGISEIYTDLPCFKRKFEEAILNIYLNVFQNFFVPAINVTG